MPVNVTGLDIAPAAGDKFYVLNDIAEAREIASQRHMQGRLASLGTGAPEHVTLENLFERLGTRGSANAEHHSAGRRARLDRSDAERVRQAGTSGSEDQSAAGHGRRHQRGRRAPGRRLGRGDHRLQRGAGRKSPHAGRAPRRADSPLRHHLPGDRRFEESPGRHAQAGEARSRAGPGT